MPNTTPALDEPGVLARIRAAAVASGSPVELLALRRGDAPAGRARPLAALGELADAGVGRASATTGRRSARAAILRNALAYAGALGLPIVDHPEDPTLTEGAEANDGLRRDGPRGCAAGRARPRRPRSRGDIAILAEVVARRAGRAAAPDPRLDGRVARARPAREGARPAGHLRRDAAPPGADRRVGRRRAALGVGGATRRRRPGPVGATARSTGRPTRPSLRVNPPLRVAGGRGGVPGGARSTAPPTRSPRTTRRTPRSTRRSSSGARPTGSAASRRRSGCCSRRSTPGSCRCRGPIEALTTGPARSSAHGARRSAAVGLVEGAPADLVVFDRSERWTVDAGGAAVAGQELAAARDASCRAACC